MNTQTVDELTAQIKDDLRVAMKARKPVEVSALRSLLARISNAEAVQPTQAIASDDAAIAGAHLGVGSTETARRTLTPADVDKLIADEIKELQEAMQSVGEDSGYGQELSQKITLISKYTG
jgi:hypothetical protein